MRKPIPINFPARIEPGPATPSEPLSPDARLYSSEEVAQRLGVSERWLRDHATRRQPRIRAVKLGPLVRFRWCDVQAFVAEMAEKNPSKPRRRMVQ